MEEKYQDITAISQKATALQRDVNVQKQQLFVPWKALLVNTLFDVSEQRNTISTNQYVKVHQNR